MGSSFLESLLRRAPWLRWMGPAILAAIVGAPVVGYGLGQPWAVAFLFESATLPSRLLVGFQLPLAAMVLLYSIVAGVFAMLALDELLLGGSRSKP
ncbi:MAG: hypothetical protein SVG88_05410 [Halobacteriales archaeon]|nr:hypothetical protein [Halobacteriales archaeon]